MADCSSFCARAVSRSIPARYSFDLGELVVQAGDFAHQAQHRRAAVLDGLFLLLQNGLATFAGLVLFDHALARTADLSVEFR